MKKYRQNATLYRDLNLPFMVKLKSILTGLFFSTTICIILYLILINLLFFSWWVTYLILCFLVVVSLHYYVTMFFYEKALNVYDERTKNIDFRCFRLVKALGLLIGMLSFFIIGGVLGWY